MANSVPGEIVRLQRQLAQVEKGSRVAHGASIENAAIEVKDGAGSLRTIVGVQADGTSGVNVVNGGPPPTPSTPTVASAIGGIAVGWDGTNADGAILPLDWSRIEVHASSVAGFDPVPETLQATMETPQGAISYLPVSGPTYVRLLARNTSGAASAPTTVAGPYSPRPVAGDIGIGEIVSTMISDGAVTTPKLFANAVTTPKLAAGSVDAVALKADAITGKTITGGTMTGSLIQTAATGDRITLNEANANKVLVYDATIVSAIAELSKRGLLVQGTNGSTLWLDPNNAYPNLRLTNAGQTNSAVINVSENTAGAADIGLNSGTFTGSSFSDMKWRTFFGNDFWVAERIRNSSASTTLGGRLSLSNDRATVGFYDSANPTTATNFFINPGYTQLSKSRLEIYAPASANSALYTNADSGHTGMLLRAQYASTNKFTVDIDGNTVAAGTLTAGNIATGTVSITPSAAHTPTSALVTFSCTGTTFRGYATASTTVPGVRSPLGSAGVTGVGVSSVTSTSMLVWVNRENTTSTNINWMVIGS